jgi:hypothetical protein
VGARPPQPDRARRDPRAAAGPPRPQGDNVCIPVGPADFDPHARGQWLQPRFDDIALIDFAFSLVSGERLESALPIAQQADYEYQSPRLLRALEAGRHGDLAPTRQLDWRCDLFSLAAMLWRYLPELEDTTTGAWTRPRHAKARALVRRLIEAHDAELPAKRPHAELIALAGEPLAQPELSESLQRGWTLAFDSRIARAASPTPVTRIALPVVTAVAPVATAVTPVPAIAVTPTTRPVTLSMATPIAAVDAALRATKPAEAAPRRVAPLVGAIDLVDRSTPAGAHPPRRRRGRARRRLRPPARRRSRRRRWQREARARQRQEQPRSRPTPRTERSRSIRPTWRCGCRRAVASVTSARAVSLRPAP